MEKHRKKPASIKVEDYLITEKSMGVEVPIMPHECVAVSAKLLPKVFRKMKALSKVERIYQIAIMNAAMIEYLDRKERELGIDLETMVETKSQKGRALNGDLRKALEVKENH